MPRLQTVCAIFGCPELVQDPRINVCPEHDSGARWGHRKHRRWAQAVKDRDGRCVRCGAAGPLIAHHVDGIGPQGPRGLDLANGESLCRACHAGPTHPKRPSW